MTMFAGVDSSIGPGGLGGLAALREGDQGPVRSSRVTNPVWNLSRDATRPGDVLGAGAPNPPRTYPLLTTKRAGNVNLQP